MSKRDISGWVNGKVVIGVTNLVTSHTLHLIPKLALEEIHNQAVVPTLVGLPLLLACDLRWEPLELCFPLRCDLDLWLLQNSVQVLVQAIEQEAQELLGIVLI